MRYSARRRYRRLFDPALITLWRWSITLVSYAVLILFLVNFNRLTIYVRLAPDSSLFAGFIPLVTAVILILLAVSGVHEVGHLIAGKLAGLRFQLLIIGPLKLTHVQGRLRWGWSRGGWFNGLAASIPEQNNNLRQRMLLFAVGGPLASLLLTGIIAVLAWVSHNNLHIRQEMAWIPESLFLTTAVSAFFFLSAMRPGHYQNGLLTDGGRILMLLRGNAPAARWCALVALNSANMQGVRPRDWDPHLIQQAQSFNDGSYDDLTAQLLTYQWALDNAYLERASLLLETAVNSRAAWVYGARRLLALEKAYLLAWYQHQAEEAHLWLDQGGHGVSVLHHRTEAAVSLAAGHYMQAKQMAEAGLDALPTENLSGTNIAEREWLSAIRVQAVDSLEKGKTPL